MSRIARIGSLVTVLAVFVTFSACGKDQNEEAASSSDILQFVPADAPYAFATLEPFPDDLLDKFEPQLEMMLKTYADVINGVIDAKSMELPEGSQQRENLQISKQVAVELLSMLSPEGMGEAGLERDAQFALYGNGLLPVVRISVSNAGKFEQALDRIEAKAGKGMDKAEIDGHSYRLLQTEELKIVLGQFDGFAVITGMPATFGDEQLRRVIGLEKPAESMADSGTLARIGKEYGLTNHMIGFVDSNRLVSTFIDKPSGVNADLFSLTGYDASIIDDVCREEFREIAGVVPRMVVGYTRADEDAMDTVMAVELRTDIAAGLSKITAAVPGVGSSTGGLFSYGMGFDVRAMMDFYEARLDAMEADPFECQQLMPLQAGVASGRAVLNQPIPPMVYDVSGFNIVIDDIKGLDVASKRPPEEIDGSLLLAMKNPSTLIMMGSMMSPELAALDIQPDGKAVEFTPQQLAGVVDQAFLAMTDDALALSIGAGAEKDVTEVIEASTVNPPPFLSMSMDAARYYAFLGEAMTMGADLPGAADTEKTQQAMAEMMNAIGDLYERVDANFRFTARGIEIDSRVTVAE